MRLESPPSSEISTASAGTPSGGFFLAPPAPLTILAKRPASAFLAAISASLIEAYMSRISFDLGSSLQASLRSARASSKSHIFIEAAPRRKSAFTLDASGTSLSLSAVVQFFTTIGQSLSFSEHCDVFSKQERCSSNASFLSVSSLNSYSFSTHPTADVYLPYAASNSPAFSATPPSTLSFLASASLSPADISHRSFSGSAHDSNSTSNFSVAPPGIFGGDPESP
mmetsp:Transcript_11536/g.19391  ORF Transcript_11536/g.19391 Transcript_11536/m.19391 type:complete len:225 (-) Transcript_11536:177-851(-)